MSQENILQNVVQVQTVALKELSNYTPVKNTVDSLAGIVSQDIVNSLKTEINTYVHTQEENLPIKSTNELRGDFNNTFKSLHMDGSIQMDNEVKTKQAVFLKTLSRLDFKISDNLSVKNDLTEVLNAKDSIKLNEGIVKVMNNIQAQHTNVFAASVANTVKIASVDAGFENIRVNQNQNLIRVEALNGTGQSIVSEVYVDKNTQVVNLGNKSFGFVGDECEVVMEKYNNSLKKQGVVFTAHAKKRTGGDSAFIRNNELKELSRTRKLNQRNNLLNN